MHKSKRKWDCVYCGYNTKLEHFFLYPEVWALIHPSESGMVCVGCCETRLGRSLRPADFTGAHINDPRRNAMSDRLRSRLTI